MEPLGIIYGLATFFGVKGVLKAAKQPLRKAAVFTTSQVFNTLDCAKETAYNIKEGFEDIIAEAQYENLKRNQSFMDEDDTQFAND
ncbi:hypothetical protein R9X47_04430 [Wukongibacter baidiensis]|uniref:hypothetical protein n=1 Tax=Wukongibacter baidiensis TaxID=1723361 RepID=UPI003D7F6C94